MVCFENKGLVGGCGCGLIVLVEKGVEFMGGLCGYGGSSFGLEGSGMFLLGNRSLLSINHCHRFESEKSAD